MGRFLLKVGTALAVCALAANCSSSNQIASKKDPKLGVAPSPRVVAQGPIPKGGGRHHVGKSYKIGGKWYHPKEDPTGYRTVGMASWYGDAFQGRKTANGEVFDMNALTGAHPTLPLPSYVRVTNLDNGRAVTVRINDRGPFHSSRVLDVSKRTADTLGFRHRGMAKVQVDYVRTASLNGSDDRVLLASLTENGKPLHGGASSMVASAAPVPAWTPSGASRKAPPAPTVVASAETRPDAARAAEAMTVAAAMPVETLPLPRQRPAGAVSAPAPSHVASAAPARTNNIFADRWGGTIRAASLDPAMLRAKATSGPMQLAMYKSDGGLSPAGAQAAPSSATAFTPTAAPSLYVQAGAFRDPANAGRIGDRLASRGGIDISPVGSGGQTLYRVLVGPLADEGAAAGALIEAQAAGADGARIVSF